MPMNGRFIELMKDTIKFRLGGIVLEISIFKVTAPEVFDNSAFCMMLVPSIVYTWLKKNCSFVISTAVGGYFALFVNMKAQSTSTNKRSMELILASSSWISAIHFIENSTTFLRKKISS